MDSGKLCGVRLVMSFHKAKIMAFPSISASRAKLLHS